MPKARVQKRLYYKIGEACKTLGIQPYVLRYWETEFPALAPSKSRSGQRVYNEKELEIIRRIKELLYDEGYTIAGAKKKLEAELATGALSGEELDGDEDGAGEAGEEDGEAAAPATAPAPLQPKATKTAPRRKAPASTASTVPDVAAVPLFEEAAPESAPPDRVAALDTEGGERVQRLRLGIETALQEARELLALLDSKSPF